jgi:hypothetical protein
LSEERAGLPEPDDTDDLDLEEPDEPDEAEELDVGEGEEPEAAQETEIEARPEPKRPSREQRRVQTLARRLRETEQEVARLRQQPLPQLQPVDPYRQAELDRLEAERVMMMAPHEVAKYYADKNRTETTQALTRQQVQFGDMLDRQNFEALKREEKAAARLESQIENLLIQARQQGMNLTREAIYNQLFAQEARANLRRVAEKQRKGGRERIAAQTVQPGQGRSGAAAPRRQRGEPTAEEDEALLRGVRLGDVW